MRFNYGQCRERFGAARAGSEAARRGRFVEQSSVYLITALTAGYFVSSLTGELQRHLTLSVGGQVAIGLGAAGFLLHRARLLGWSRAWLLMSASLFLTQAATAGSLVYAVLSGSSATPWFLFAIYLAAYPFIFVAVLLLAREHRPLLPRSGLATLAGWLDSTIVLVGGGLACAYTWLMPALRGGNVNGTSILFMACNALMALVLLFAITRYALRQGRSVRPAVRVLLTVGMIGALATFVVAGAQEARGGYVPGGPADAVYVVGLATLAWAGFLPSTRDRDDEIALHGRAKPIKALLPIAAVILGLSLLVFEARDQLRTPLGGVILSTVALVFFVVTRQVVAVIENGRLEAQKAAQRVEKRFSSLVNNSSDIIIVTDPDTTVSYATPSAERLLGPAGGLEAGARLIDMVAPELRQSALATVASCLEQPLVDAETEWLVWDGEGAWRHFDVVIVNLLDDPTVRGLVHTMRDVEERVRFEAQLEKQIFYDPLTGLANRVLFGDRLEHALARARRGGSQIAILFADLDDFKLVNDTGGHVLGDRLLVQVAERIKESLRAGDTPARLGGDEFSVLIEDLSDVLQATSVAERLLECLRPPFRVDDSELTISASIGVVISSGENDTPEELLRHADTAMYSAKRAGGDRFEIFEPNMQAAIHRRLELQAELRRGINEHEFTTFYQPVVDLASGQVRSLEALVRWKHPERGLLTPPEFIDVAEQAGLITAIGQQVLLQACSQVKAWTDAELQEEPLSVAVNFSPRQLREPYVVSMVSQALAETGLPPTQLVIELTEEVLIEGEQATGTKLWALKDLGVRLAIDDFGTGYSSLARLNTFPFDYLKIDRQFIDHITEGKQGSAVARTIIGLATSLGLRAVAEGVERPEQREKLVSLGCRFGQGFLFSQPLDGERIPAFLQTARAGLVLEPC